MLIRLIGHFIDNPNRIDKLICIKGLPDEWFFRPSRFGGKELIKPWEPDVEANIPRECRYLCDPFEITEVFSPIEKGKDFVVDKRTISAVRFDYVTEAGQTMWDKIERYIDKSLPRDIQVPKPVLVAPDHKSNFSPHEARRSVRGSLEMRAVEEIPVIDLRPSQPAIAVTTVSAPAQTAVNIFTPQQERFSCVQCPKTFEKQQALKMHVMRSHEKKEAVGV